jgi:hypothetical protein
MRATLIVATISLLSTLAGAASAAEPFLGIDPGWILLHEPEVIEELKLSHSQRQEYQKLIDDVDLRVFPLRNKSRDEILPALDKVFAEIQQGLKSILRPAQEKRLNEISMRRRGTAALLRDEVAAKMHYTDSQRKAIEKIIGDTQSEVTALEKEASEGKPREPLEKKFIASKTDEQKQILKLLKPNQQAAWRELVGADFDMTKLGAARVQSARVDQHR